MTEALYAVASKLYQIVRPVRDRHYLAHIRTFPCHRELHRIGAARFQVKHGIDFPALIIMFQEFYWLEFPGRKEAA